MYTVKIMNEFLHGPVWVYNEDGFVIGKFPRVYDDSVIKELNHRANELFSSYYEFDSHGVACWFNEEQEKADKEQMLSIIEKIVSRLSVINDGSFTIEDCETARLNAL